jgi:nucleotidyltransferase AbiEii toxin of type IV toxin-antitoxin system
VTKKKRPAGPNFRTELQRRARTAGIKDEDLDRALIIGQLAGLLVKDRRLRGRIAHKGAAVLRLVHASSRLSADLDSGDIRGLRVNPRVVIEALSTAEAKKVVLRAAAAGNSASGCAFLVECRSLRGGSTTIKISINWSEPFVLAPIPAHYKLPDGTPITVPVMQPLERAAEKVRAFLSRGEASDAYDLWFYWTQVLTPADRDSLAAMTKRKLRSPASRVPASATDMLRRFDEMREVAREEWRTGRNLVIEGTKPVWDDVDRALSRFKARTPRTI